MNGQHKDDQRAACDNIERDHGNREPALMIDHKGKITRWPVISGPVEQAHEQAEAEDISCCDDQGRPATRFLHTFHDVA